MSEAVIDTNVFVHAIVEDSPLHTEARNLLVRLRRWLVPTIVVYELVWVLRKLGVSAEEASNTVRSILKNPRTAVLTDSGDHTEWALRALCEEELSLAHFNDKVIIATAVRTGASLATYDEEVRKESVKRGVTLLLTP